MKFVIVFAALIAASVAALLPGATQEAQATIVSQQADISPDLRTYSYSSQTSNGIAASEQGQLTQPRSADETAAYATQGEFSWTAPDGQHFSVHYTADASGFHPEAAHLPVSPVA
ncbi:larval cuticle protein 65Ag1-like [Sitodiplosis mosellana]|uniref:larval cuticle protein 65Ag1-like n=1 Tax=Sitodiplosis mosellana TaxID=263140 RepID=UPI002443F39F|nr:larval cuticle protein 65Ag1-like [Sitodiplosis mosellana]